MPILTLTVQPTGAINRYRLGVRLADSLNYFQERGVPVTLILAGQNILTSTTCGPPSPKGFDLYSPLLNQWILEYDYHIYPPGHPTKLLFDFNVVDGIRTLTFIGVA
jgi:hypothetical protein